MDLFSRKIIVFDISCKNDVALTVNTFKSAFEIRNHPNNLTFIATKEQTILLLNAFNY